MKTLEKVLGANKAPTVLARPEFNAEGLREYRLSGGRVVQVPFDEAPAHKFA